MGKYIVELKKNETLYKAATRESDGTAYVCSAIGTPYTEPNLEQVRKEAYEQGLSDEKERKATCQYCEYQYLDDTEEPCKKCCNAYMNKYKPKAKEEQIQVGDEIEAVSGKAVVVYVDDVDEHKVRYVYSNGVYAFNYIDKVTKTGRHFPEIAAVFEKMREESNG